jgi:8-oxo-dGTP pyrophosphatase MutT (NUDIX family)
MPANLALPHPEFCAAVARALTRELPGVRAQQSVAPHPPGAAPFERPREGGRAAAALVLLYPRDETPHFVLILRSDVLLDHPGQIGLPGGGLEPGETTEQAALRETEEEIGISASSIRLLGGLSPVYIPPTDLRLTPWVGCTFETPRFVPCTFEVSRILEVRLRDLLDPPSRKEEIRHLRDGQVYVVPYFELAGQKVWGATAMVLAELAAVLESFPA